MNPDFNLDLNDPVALKYFKKQVQAEELLARLAEAKFKQVHFLFHKLQMDEALKSQGVSLTDDEEEEEFDYTTLKSILENFGNEISLADANAVLKRMGFLAHNGLTIVGEGLEFGTNEEGVPLWFNGHQHALYILIEGELKNPETIGLSDTPPPF